MRIQGSERTVRKGRTPRRAWIARTGVAALLLLGAVPAAHAAGVPGDTVPVENHATLTYEGKDGLSVTTSASATVRVDTSRAVRVTPAHEVAMVPGERKVLPHRVENTGGRADRFRVEAAGPPGWRLALYHDVDGSGTLGAGDVALTEPLSLAAREGAGLLLVLDAPDDAGPGEVQAEVRATSETVATVAGAARDRITVRQARLAATLDKRVDRAEAAPGDTLRYTLAYANRNDAPLSGVVVRDLLPPGARYLAGSLRLDDAPLTDAADGDAGEREAGPDGREGVRVRLGTLAPGATGTVSLAVVVADDAPRGGTLANVGTLSFGETELASRPAETRVVAARLVVSKALVGSDTVRVGELVAYRIGYANRSTVASIPGVVLVDTLPPQLAPVSAEGAEIEGQVVRWRLGALPPGASGTVTVTARAIASGQGAATVVNRVVGEGGGVATATATATTLTVSAPSAGRLEIGKQAGVLEGSVGEAIPYRVTLRNRGAAPLEGIVVHDLLPEGTRFVGSSVAGADSARLEGRELRLYVAGPVAAGAEHEVRYAVVLGSPGKGSALANRAWAEAEGGALRTDTAVAWVRLRAGFAMQGQTLLGKVWLDENGNGRQDAGERGVHRASVLSVDGEVVTTDGEGRFSFRNLRPGAHLLRLDTVGLPAGYGPPEAGGMLARVRMDGWTAPYVSFRLVPAPAPEAKGKGGEGVAGPREGAGERAVPRVSALRSAGERRREEDGAFASGPVVRFTAPADGTVLGTNRLFVGVRGEPGARVRIYDGERLLHEATLRPDGVYDLIGVELSPGPHRLRVWMRNSWENERWDSVAVHRTGEPERFELPEGGWTVRTRMPDAAPLRVRLLDRWGVPVADEPRVTVAARGATVEAEDADASSVGVQLPTGPDGVVQVPLRGGAETGAGELALAVGGARAVVALRILPAVLPLMVTGAGQVGVGAAPEAFGALVVRGSLGEATSVRVTYDSRRGGEEDDFFARGYDPLEETRYPTLGDRSERQTLSGATQALSARVERGLDWLELGDVTTPGFGRDGTLGAYRRALTGVSGRVAAGPVVWSGFGSVTDQSLDQRQLRGDGSTGPYSVGRHVRPGTERIVVEVRAPDNAARVLARRELVRFLDYHVDYTTGAVLLQRPIPATDPYGNPVFLVATVERRSGGEARVVGGVRMEVDAGRLVTAVDSLAVAVFGVREGAMEGMVEGGVGVGSDLLGGDLYLRHAGLEAEAELLRAVRPDSAAFAGRVDAAWSAPGDRVRLEAGWLRVEDGFGSAANPRLASALDEVHVGGELRLQSGQRIHLRHERQEFHSYGVERQSTLLRVEQTVAGRKLLAQSGLTSDLQADGVGASSASGRASLALSPDVELWLEGGRGLSSTGGAPPRPDHVGGGASYRILPGLRLEGSRRWAFPRGDSASFALTSVGVRLEEVLGGQVWGGVERTGAEQASHSAVLGWNQRLLLPGGWALTSLFERRAGLSRAPLLDPARALPFAHVERDRWSAGLGAEWLPSDSTARFSARGELHRGEERRGHRIDVAGDVPLGESVALLTRHDWSAEERPGSGPGRTHRRDRSLLGFALRPTGSESLNALAKVEWRRTTGLAAGDLFSGGRDETRLIGSADVVWLPGGGAEVAGRYAVRRILGAEELAGAPSHLSAAHYLGARLGQRVHGRLSARLDGRTLLEEASGMSLWSLAPSVALRVAPELELEGGYRFGTLLDPDFLAAGGNGPFLTLGVTFTEGTAASAADFWRTRVRAEQ